MRSILAGHAHGGHGVAIRVGRQAGEVRPATRPRWRAALVLAPALVVSMGLLAGCDDKDNECTTAANNQVGAVNAGSSDWKNVYDNCKNA